MGITTAEDVPARIAPRSSADRSGMPSASIATAVTMAPVAIKQPNVNLPVVPSDFSMTSSRRDVPLSKSITTRAMVANTGPTLPKSAGLTQPINGPASSPITIKSSTSGMFVRRNSTARKCETKISRPMIRMMVDIGGISKKNDQSITGTMGHGAPR